jgi:ABC-type Mn2+/Zn2+ transport system permease subunit
MQTLRYLSDPDLAPLFWPPVVTALAIAAMCSLLSVLVVLKRLAFIGQGISHAALGGIGVAVALGLVGVGLAQATGQFAVVLIFCLGAGLLVGFLSDRSKTQSDTAIGVVLVASMSVGAILLDRFARTSVSWESFLFGSINDVSWADAAIAWVSAIATLLVLWLSRRPLIFWAFDTPVAKAVGIHHAIMKGLLMGLLALATVVTMKLAGVVLATAMLVMPGATALRLSERWVRVVVIAHVFGLIGVAGGLVLSFELDWLPGASIVIVLSVCFGAAWAWSKYGAGRRMLHGTSSARP